ncbi:hypothetical protein YPPY66_2167, partial [Yersinia pestis PY-66]
MFISLIKQVV